MCICRGWNFLPSYIMDQYKDPPVFQMESIRDPGFLELGS